MNPIRPVAFALRGVLVVGLIVLGALALSASEKAEARSISALWGERGENWTVDGRLPDFSRAGYQEGEVPLPEVAQTTSVRDFGAVGDGVTDDTKAFNAAIAATNRGAVWVPPGRYVITDYVQIQKSGVVLRGAGPDRSVLWFPCGLDETHPRLGRTSTGSPASGYSFDGAFVKIQGDYQAKELARITATAKRGDASVEVDRTSGVVVGQTVFVVLREAAGHSLKTYLYNGDPGDIRKGKQLDTKMLVRVVAVHGTRVTFDRPLRFETRAEWTPELRSFRPTVTESGIEGIGFEFPAVKYRGHFKEHGFNAIELRSVADCWVRNVTIHNGDLGINVVACRNTLEGVTVTAASGRASGEGPVEVSGHHGIQCKGAEDNLVTRFDFQTCYVHDLSVEHASGNVFAGGRGTDLCFDHHKDSPYANLFTDIDCGRGTRVWRCGGGTSLGRQSAAWETFWSIRAERPVEPPPVGWGAPGMNFVGLSPKISGMAEPSGWWFEVMPPERLAPRDLHAAQLAWRLGERR